MDDFADLAEKLAEKYGPHVVDSARAAVQTEVYSSLVASGIQITIAVVFFCGGWYLWQNVDDVLLRRALGSLAYALAGLSALIGLWTWVDPWTWTALYNPDVYIAKRVLKI